MKYFAHRGIIEKELENSSDAIIKTLTSDKYDGIEVDLRLTHDKKVVLIHDKHTRRISKERLIISDTEYNMLEKLKLYVLLLYVLLKLFSLKICTACFDRIPL